MSNSGWWPDPSGRHELRYHDGTAWSEHVSDRGAVSRDPVDSPRPPVPPPPPPMPEPASAVPPIVQQLPEPTSFAKPAAGTDPFAPPAPTASPMPITSSMSAPTQAYIAPYDQPGPQGFPIGSSPIIQEAGGPRRLWLGIAVVAALIFAGALAFIVTRDDDTTVDRQPVVPTSAPTSVITPGITAPQISEQQTTPTTGAIAPPAAGTTAPLVPATDAPTLPPTAPPAPPAQGIAAVGTALTAEGSVVRVNRITPNAPVDEFFAPTAPTTVTAVEIEACAGPDGFGFNTFSWTAFQADNTTLENFFFGDDVQSVQIAPGGCARGTITYEVPGGGAIDELVLTGATFDEVGRWTVAGATEPTDRLTPPVPPTVIPVGQTATVGAGHTVTLRSVTDDTPPIDDFFSPDPGRQYSQLDVELCAGTESLTVNGLYWFGVATDSWMGTAALLGDTLPLIDLAAGQCAAGIVQIDLPAGSEITQVVYTDQGLAEQVRWQAG